MKTLTLTLSDGAFRAIKSEATVYNLCHAGGTSVLTTFATKVVKAMEAGEAELEIKTRDEREKDKECLTSED